MHRSFLILIIITFVVSCTPKLKITEGQIKGTNEQSKDIYIFSKYEQIPLNAHVIGKLETKGMMLSKTYTINQTLELIKASAVKLGGDAIKITEIKPPQLFGSEAYDIKADVLQASIPTEDVYSMVDKILPDDSAFYVSLYRLKKIFGSGVSYPIFINGHFICGLDNGQKKIIRIKNSIKELKLQIEHHDKLIELKLFPSNEKIFYVRCRVGINGEPEVEKLPLLAGAELYDKLK